MNSNVKNNLFFQLEKIQVSGLSRYFMYRISQTIYRIWCNLIKLVEICFSSKVMRDRIIATERYKYISATEIF